MAAAPQPAAVANKVDDDCSIAGDDDAERATASGLAVHVGAGGQSAPAPGRDDDDGIVGGPTSAAAPPPPAGVFPDKILGQSLRKVQGRSGGGWNYHSLLTVHCPNTLHERCSKSKSTDLEKDVVGCMAPVFFLGAWLQRAGDLPEEAHRKYKPNNVEVRNFPPSIADEGDGANRLLKYVLRACKTSAIAATNHIIGTSLPTVPADPPPTIQEPGCRSPRTTF